MFSQSRTVTMRQHKCDFNNQNWNSEKKRNPIVHEQTSSKKRRAYLRLPITDCGLLHCTPFLTVKMFWIFRDKNHWTNGSLAERKETFSFYQTGTHIENGPCSPPCSLSRKPEFKNNYFYLSRINKICIFCRLQCNLFQLQLHSTLSPVTTICVPPSI